MLKNIAKLSFLQELQLNTVSKSPEFSLASTF